MINAGTRTSVGRLNPRAAAAVPNTGVPAVAVAPPPPAAQPVSDDWQCDGCGNSNFNWRKSCKRCGAQKSKAVKDAEQKTAAGWLHVGLRDTSNRIFVKGFDPSTTTESDLNELFSGIGIIARVRQKFGFPDQWPHAVKIYKDNATGANKDEAVIKYDDPMAAQSAPGFYDGHVLNGKTLSVTIATSREDREGGGEGRGRGPERGRRVRWRRRRRKQRPRRRSRVRQAFTRGRAGVRRPRRGRAWVRRRPA